MHGHNPPQTSCAPWPTGRLGAGSRPWKARDVLCQTLDENNNIQTSTDRCTTSSTVNSSIWYWCVCATYSLLGTQAYMLYSDVEAKTLYYLLQMMIPLLLSPTRGGGHEKTHGMRDRRRNVYVSLEVWMFWLGFLTSITIVHGAYV